MYFMMIFIENNCLMRVRNINRKYSLSKKDIFMTEFLRKVMQNLEKNLIMTGKEFFPGPIVTGYNSVFSKQSKTKLFIFFQFNEIGCLLHFFFVVTNGRCQS
jgi:hypothetical protein